MRIALAAALLAFAWPGAAPAATGQAVTLRIAANVPTNSPWDLGLKRMAAEIERESAGKVRIEFPLTARVSTESDIIQRMRFGLDGALLTTFGLAELYPDILALSMPSFIDGEQEFNAVLAAVAPIVKSKLAGRFVVLAITKGGWVRYFSRSPIVYPADLEGLRISLDPSQEKEIMLMQSAGARVVEGTSADFLLQLNSNAVDAACVSPIYVATLWSQLRGKIEYMSSFKVAPFIGALVFNTSSWERVPAELRPRLERLVAGMAARIGRDSAALEDQAIASLDGIKTPPEPADAAAKWAEMTALWRKGLFTEMFSPDILETMDSALAGARLAERGK